MEENYIDFKCPYCGADLAFQHLYAGTAQGCAQCPESVVVPMESTAVGGIFPVSITTPRLVLRRFQHGDWKDLLEVMSDAELFKYTDWAPQDEEGVVRWIESDRDVRLTQPGASVPFGIQLQEGGNLIGFTNLAYLDNLHRQASLAAFINRNFQRQGYGGEAIGAMLDLGFRGLNLHRVSASCDSRNQAAARMLEKAGLRREGEFVKDSYRNGEWFNTLWYAVLKEEHAQWPEERKKSVLHTQVSAA